MKTTNIVIGLVAILVLIFVFYRHSAPSSSVKKETIEFSGKVVTIVMTDDGFSPSEVTIKEGDKVTFVNEGKNPHWPASNFHPTHGIYPEFDPLKGILPGDEWSFILKVGKWHFHDHLYPSFTGTIVVEP